MGAALAAPATSSETCAAESSGIRSQSHEVQSSELKDVLHPVSVHIGEVKARRNAQPSTRDQM